MCRWLVYRGEPVYLDTLVTEPKHSLMAQSLKAHEAKIETNGDGFGVGWYGERDVPGLFREPFPAWNDDNLRGLCQQIRSRFFFAHVRSSTGTPVSRANCHPFVMGKWMFMHNGQIGGYDRLRRALEFEIDEKVYVHRKGTTDSELLFLMAMSHGGERDPVGALRFALAHAESLMRSNGISEPLKFAAAIGDGHTLHAFRYSSDGQSPSLSYRCSAGGLVVVSEPLDRDEPGAWTPVPEGSVLSFSAETGCSPVIATFNPGQKLSAAAE